ncbi:integrase and RNaseH domain-containing protein [Golovinomyces cichoracearum]|uniref:Integrase and RNaseH domain-containing protein n=1 Tax=Golovinomyces cichoracearum TaxID=62708 RepID=A0A420IM14_9PEZI|nr:integrase and RNaseH domain-containing protein [Golovinomyces cichoracearum]
MSFEIPIAWNSYITEKKGETTIVHEALEFDLWNVNTHTQPILNAYILKRLQYYKITEKKDRRLWNYFRCALHETLNETEKHKWTPEKLVKAKEEGDFISFAYKTPPGSSKMKEKVASYETKYPSYETFSDEKLSTKQTSISVLKSPVPFTAKNINSSPYSNVIDEVLKSQISVSRQTGSSLFPHYNTPLDPTTSKMLADLIKMYNDDRKNFRGKLFDILDNKLRVFFDNCQKIGLPSEQLSNVYSIILKHKAADFYYKNPEKSRKECLKLLFDNLLNLQRGLSVVYQEGHSLRDQILNACQGIPECKMALMKPAPTYEGVCADLRSATSNEMQCRGFSQFLSHNKIYISDQQENKVNWTHRTYGGRGKSKDKSDYRNR